MFNIDLSKILTNDKVKSLPTDKIEDFLKLKAFAKHILNVIQNIKFVLQRVGDIMGKDKNAR